MKKQMNEANVKIDIDGLESSDMETLSRMLALAGQAEAPRQMGFSEIPRIEPLNLDTPEDEVEVSTVVDTPDDLDAAAASLTGSVSDFGDDDELSVDIDDEDSVEYDTSSDDMDFEDDSFDSHFDMDRMSDLAGISEAVQSEETDEDDIEAEADDEEEELDESLLPDLSLDEDSIESMKSVRSEFGPFRSEMECVQDGQSKTNGYEGDNFVVIPKGDGFYWKRTVQEDAVGRPEGECYDDDGIKNSRHNIKDKRNALGDNKLLYPVHESDEDDEKVLEEIKESINAKFAKFMGGNNVQF